MPEFIVGNRNKKGALNSPFQRFMERCEDSGNGNKKSALADAKHTVQHRFNYPGDIAERDKMLRG